MRVVLTWPIGSHQPNEVIDVAPQLGDVLCREGFARSTVDPVPPEPAPPTIAEFRAYMAEHGVSMSEARPHFAEDLARRRAGTTPT